MNNVPDKAKIIELVKHLNDNPDKLHNDITPCVLELGKMETYLIVPFLETALNSSDENTRLHAQRALEYSFAHNSGFVIGQGWANPKGEEMYEQTWFLNGNYKYDAPREDRKKSIQKWLRWAVVID